MARLTLCHTADWHLGHTLYRRGREHEHARFLAWLLDALEARAADALVIAGDVFESSAPPGSAQAMFYGFLAEARRRMPGLAIVAVAGNHDSPARLAAPDPLLRGLGVRIVGAVPIEAGRVAPEGLVVPITREGRALGRVVAVPFLRGSDLPTALAAGPERGDAHAAGVRTVYEAAIAHARREAGEGESIVVTGHFAAAGARMSRDSERLVVGGVDGTLPIDVIDTEGVAYVALGHLHLAQRVPDGRRGEVEVRYAGAPIPLAFSERGFAHEVRFVTLEAGRVVASEGVTVPRAVPFVRSPDEGVHPSVEAALEALEALGFEARGFEARGLEARAGAGESPEWPWLEVRVRAGRDERDAAEQIERAAAERAVRLARVVVEREVAPPSEAAARVAAGVDALDVRGVYRARFASLHAEAEPAEAVLDALDEAIAIAEARLAEAGARAVDVASAARPVVQPMTLAARRRSGEGG
jgi:exonuclease SbcD